MGLFSRKKKSAEREGERPRLEDQTPNDERENPIAEHNMEVILAEREAIREEIGTGNAFDPLEFDLLKKCARLFYNGESREPLVHTISLASTGYLLRRHERYNGADGLDEAQVDALLSAPDVEALLEPDVDANIPGYQRTLAACFHFRNLPFEGSDGLKHGLLDPVVPGQATFIRWGVELQFLEATGGNIDEDRPGEMGMGGYLISDEYVRKGAFGSGFMLHVFGEVAPDGWLDGFATDA